VNSTGPSKEDRPVVLILHGIWRTRLSMRRLEAALRRAGYEVINRTYPALRLPIPLIAEDVARLLEPYRDRAVSIVAHSMGGLVARAYLGRYRTDNVRRLVMIATPNQGAWLAAHLHAHRRLGPMYRLLFAANAAQLLPEAVKGLPLPCCEFGVIAGGTGRDCGFARYLPGDNDGTVCVTETHLPGEADFVLVPHSHAFIMNGRATIDAVLRFLETGRFRSEETRR
jgi:triacylglycerol lipase